MYIVHIICVHYVYIYISAVKFKILDFSGELKILTFLFSRISNL